MGESSITGPDLIRDTSEKVSLIRQHLLMAQSQQKSYDDVRRRPLEFEVGDHVFLKMMPKGGVVRFGMRGKLSPRFIGSFEILEMVGTVVYRLALPPNMSGVHKVFHVSMLRKFGFLVFTFLGPISRVVSGTSNFPLSFPSCL